MRQRAFILVMLFLSSGLSSLYAGDRPASTRAMSFLELGIGPRAFAMGEAFTGLADDITSLSWNPAGLALLPGSEILFMHNQWIVNLRQEFLAGNYPLLGGVAGLQVSYLNSDIQLRRNEDGLVTGDGFSPYSLMAGLGYGYKLLPELAVGGTVNYAREQLDDITYQTMAIDLGVLYHPESTWWSIGASMLHAGLPVAGYPLPLTIRLGGAIHLFQDSLNITADVARTIPGWFRYSMGAEYWYRNLFAIRAGYLLRPEFEGLDRLSGLRLGVGFNIQGYQVDYAIIPQGDLGYGHRASLTYFFSGGRALLNEKKALITQARRDGEQALAKKEYSQAINAFQKVLTFLPTDVTANAGVKKATTGLRLAEQAEELAARLKTARNHIKKGQLKEAIEEFQRILLIDENHIQAKQALAKIQARFNSKMIRKHLKRGRKAFKELRWADALLAWQSVLSIDDKHQEAKSMLAKTRKQMTKGGKGFKDPRIREYYLAGLKLFERGDYLRAIQKWNKVLRIAPNHKQTKQVLDQAAKLLKEKVADLLKAAKRYLDQGDLIRGAKNIQAVLTLSSKHPKANKLLKTHQSAFQTLAKKLYLKGIEQYTQSQLKQAIANWKDVLTLVPTYPGAKDNIKKAKKKIKALQ